MENDYLKKYQTGGAPVFEFAPVANPYVDMHQAEISKTLADRWTQNRDKYDAMSQAIGSMQVLPEEEWKKTRALKRAEDTLGSAVEEENGEVNWENATIGIRNAVNEFAADTDLIQAAESMALRKEELATQTKLGEGNYIDFGTTPVIDPNTGLIQYGQEGNVIEQHKTTGYDTAKQGLYQSGTVKRLDHINRARTLMSGIKTDFVGLQNLQNLTGALTPQDALMYLSSGDEVSPDKVMNVAKAVLPGYAASSEGQQRMRELTEKLINPETEQLYTEVEAGNVLLQDLMSTAAPQIGETQKYTASAFNKSGAGKSTTVEVGDRLLETAPSLQINPMDSPNTNFYTADGNFQYQPKTHEKILRGIADFPDLVDKTFNGNKAWYENMTEQEVIGGEYAKRIVKARVKKELDRLGPDFNIMDTDLRVDEKLMYLADQYPDLRLQDETDAAFSERLYSTFSDPEVKLSTIYTYPTAGREDYAKKLLGEISSMKIVGTDSEGKWIGDTKVPLSLDKLAANATGVKGTVNSWKHAFIEALSFQAGKINEVDNNQEISIRGIRLDGPMAGATEIVYTSPKGETFTLLVGGNDQTEGSFKDLNSIVDARNSLNTSKIVTMDATLKAKVPSITGKEFIPTLTETKLFLENNSEGTIVPILKQRAKDGSGNETSWSPVDDSFISNMTRSTLAAWQQSGNREAQYMFDTAPKSSTTQTSL